MAAKKAEPTEVEIVAVDAGVKKEHTNIEKSTAWKVTLGNSIIAAIVTISLGLIQWQTQKLVSESAHVGRETSAKVDTTIVEVGKVHVLTNERAHKQDAKIEQLNGQIQILIATIAKQAERAAVLKDRDDRTEPPNKPE